MCQAKSAFPWELCLAITVVIQINLICLAALADKALLLHSNDSKDNLKFHTDFSECVVSLSVV